VSTILSLFNFSFDWSKKLEIVIFLNLKNIGYQSAWSKNKTSKTIETIGTNEKIDIIGTVGTTEIV